MYQLLSVVLDVWMTCSMSDKGMGQGHLQTALQDKARLQTIVQQLQIQVQRLDNPLLATCQRHAKLPRPLVPHNPTPCHPLCFGLEARTNH